MKISLRLSFYLDDALTKAALICNAYMYVKINKFKRAGLSFLNFVNLFKGKNIN